MSKIVKLYPRINIAINNANGKGWTKDLKKLCKYIIEAAADFPKFIATQINKSMKGAKANVLKGGTDEDALTLFMLLSQSYMRTIITEYPKNDGFYTTAMVHI